MAPEYEKAATTLKAENIYLASVDCTEHAALCTEHKIQGYPTLKIFRGSASDSSEYQGPRESVGIISTMRRQAQPAVSKVASGDVKNHAKTDQVVFFSGYPEDSPQGKVFAGAAEKFRNDYAFAVVTNPDNTQSSRIWIEKRQEDGKVELDASSITQEALEKWIKLESLPLLDEIGPHNYLKYMDDTERALAYFFFEDIKQKEEYEAVLKEVFKGIKDRAKVVFINAKQFGQHADVLNLDRKWPAFVIHDMSKEHKYPFGAPNSPTATQTLSPNALRQFVSQWASGQVKPTFKSKPIPPASENPGPIYKIVNENFVEEVLENDAIDTLVYLNAPWCGACKSMTPQLEKLAAAYHEKYPTQIKFVSMDATENDLPDVVPHRIEYFPTLMFFPATKGKSDPVKIKENLKLYKGGAQPKALVDWISASATNSMPIDVEELEKKPEEQPKQAPAAEEGEKAKEEL